MRIVSVVFLLALFAGEVAAQPGKVVAVEGWNQVPDERAIVFLARLRESFRKKGFKRYSGAGISLAEAKRLVEEGHESFLDTDFVAAIAVLDGAIERLRKPPSSMGNAAALQPLLLRALIAKALASKRQGDRAMSAAALSMAVRGFPDRFVPLDEFGSEPRDLRKRVARKMSRKRRGALDLKVFPGSASVYVDGRLAGVGVEQLELHGGDYFVFASSGEVGSVAESVTVRSGKTAAVELRVPQGESLARAMVARGFGESILLSVWDNRLVKGTYYSRGRPVRRARIKVAADAEEIGEFVLELVAGKAESLVTSPVAPLVRRTDSQPSGGEFSIAGLVLGGAGVVVGGTLYGLGHAINEDDLKSGALITGVGGALIFATSAMVRWVF